MNEAASDFLVRRHHLLVHQHPDQGGPFRFPAVPVDYIGEEKERVSGMKGDDGLIDLKFQGP